MNASELWKMLARSAQKHDGISVADMLHEIAIDLAPRLTPIRRPRKDKPKKAAEWQSELGKVLDILLKDTQ